MSTEKLDCFLRKFMSRKLILRLVSLSKVNSSFGVSLLKHSTIQSISVLLSFYTIRLSSTSSSSSLLSLVTHRDDLH